MGGTIKHSSDFTEADKADFDGEPIDEGFYVWFGMWKGPFETESKALSAFKTWEQELKH